MERLFRLAEEISRGNQNAFDELYALTHKAVFLTAFGVLKDKMLAEDITQDTYIAAFRGMDKLREGSNVTGWLTTIARRLKACDQRISQKEARGQHRFFARKRLRSAAYIHG